MPKIFHEGQEVKWNWGQGQATGRISQVFKEKVTRTIKGHEVTRNASEEEPAYLLKQDDGSEVLKSHSEVFH